MGGGTQSGGRDAGAPDAASPAPAPKTSVPKTSVPKTSVPKTAARRRFVHPVEDIKPQKGFFGRLRNYFLAGVLVTGPVSLTVYLAWLIFEFADEQASALIPAPYNPENYLPFSLPGLGLLMMVILLIVIGWITAGYIGRLMVRGGETMMARVPVVRSVYSAIKQILETVLAQQSTAFRDVVLVEYPRRGIWALGFLTGDTRGEVQNVTAHEMVNVFLPTTPNPTSGFLLFLPAREVHILDMSVEDGIKMVISAGIITPPDRRSPETQMDTSLLGAGKEADDAGATAAPEHADAQGR